MELNLIHSDNRGKIYIITGLMLFPEVTLFKTYQNYARGGCIHNFSKEHICIIEGMIEYFYGEEKEFLWSGESFTIRKKTPHYFISLSDSIVMEWGASPEEKLEKHKEFREIVEKINSKLR